MLAKEPPKWWEEVSAACSVCSFPRPPAPLRPRPSLSLLQVLISKGMQGGQRVVIPGEVDDPMGGAPGDVIVNIVEVRHPRFTRRNADLLLEMRISLAEALTGFETSFKHLDGRTVRPRKGRSVERQAQDRQGPRFSHATCELACGVGVDQVAQGSGDISGQRMGIR